ncbi:MAG: type II secretion system F family protein [Candidatus Dormibacteraeota bacterium]|nr:type II secretion system F family protein [Candidatus Dormibacteraeota bacterium]
MSLLYLVFGLIAAAGAAMASGLVRRGPAVEDKYAAKLAGFADHAMTLEEIELSKPFRERFIKPTRDRLVALAVSRTPASRQEQMRALISTAGHPYNLTVSGMIAAKLVSAAIAGVLGALLFLGLMKLAFPLFLVVAAPPLLGWILPDRWLKQQADRRRAQIERTIPDFIDLLTICLDAGLSFDAALVRVSEKVEGALAEELTVLITEVRYGRPRLEAMEALAERIDVEDMTAFVNAVTQSQKLGVALGETVRIQAAEIRRRRRQAAEEKASQASLKMLFPMIGCIFPTLFIVLMGPVALILLQRH